MPSTMSQPTDETAEFRVPVSREVYEEFRKEFPFYGFVRMSLETYLKEMVEYSKANPGFKDAARAAAHAAIRRMET